MPTVDQIQAAAKMVEHDGVECFSVVKERFGEDIAITLIIAHLRRQLGSGKGYPSDSAIDAKVVEFLKKKHII